MSRNPRRILLFAIAAAVVLLGMAAAFFDGLILHGRFDGTAVLTATVVDHHKPFVTVDFVAPDGRRCISTIKPSDISNRLLKGDPTRVRSLPPDYCADVQLDGDAANHAAMNVVGQGLAVLGLTVFVGGLARRQQLLFEAGRPAGGSEPVVYQVASTSRVRLLHGALLFAVVLIVWAYVSPGFPAVVTWGGGLVYLGICLASWWRQIRRLELHGQTLRWLGVLRHGEIAVADIRKVDVKPREKDTPLAIFTIADRPDFRVPVGPGLQGLVHAIARTSRNFWIEEGSFPRLPLS